MSRAGPEVAAERTTCGMRAAKQTTYHTQRRGELSGARGAGASASPTPPEAPPPVALAASPFARACTPEHPPRTRHEPQSSPLHGFGGTPGVHIYSRHMSRRRPPCLTRCAPPPALAPRHPLSQRRSETVPHLTRSVRFVCDIICPAHELPAPSGTRVCLVCRPSVYTRRFTPGNTDVR